MIREGTRFNFEAFLQIAIGRFEDLCLMVEEKNGSALRVEDIADLVPHQIINGLHVQFGSQPFLHTVDDRQFGSTLFGLFEQMLSFVKKASILKRNTHAIRKS